MLVAAGRKFLSPASGAPLFCFPFIFPFLLRWQKGRSSLPRVVSIFQRQRTLSSRTSVSDPRPGFVVAVAIQPQTPSAAISFPVNGYNNQHSLYMDKDNLKANKTCGCLFLLMGPVRSPTHASETEKKKKQTWLICYLFTQLPPPLSTIIAAYC